MASVARRPGKDKKGNPYGWTVRYIDPATGKRPCATFALKKDADAYKRKVEREIEDGLHVVASDQMTVARPRPVAMARIRSSTSPYGGRQALTVTPVISLMAFME